MIHDCTILKGELSLLLDARDDELSSVRSLRSAAERVDGYSRMVRDVLDRSSLCHMDGVLSYFDGRCYTPVTRQQLLTVISNVMAARDVGASDVRKMADMPLSVLFEKQCESNPSLVCFTDCVVDIDEMRPMDFSRDLHVTYMMPYAYGGGDCQRWHAFLEEVLPLREEQDCLQEFFGLCFIDRARLSVEKMALFVGSGANGKSVVFDVMKGVLGADRVSYLSPDQLTDYKQLVTLQGKVVNFAPDVRRGASFDSALKALASSQEVNAWKLYEGSTVIKCPPLVFALNEMPFFRDVTEAFFRRVLLFGFDVTIPRERQDRTLARTIVSTEASGIFRWMMEGRRRLIANGGAFTECRKMDDSVAVLKSKVRGESSPVLSYLESIGLGVRPYYDGQQFEKIGAGAIYEGMGGAVSKSDITRELTALGVRHNRSKEVFYYLYRKQ